MSTLIGGVIPFEAFIPFAAPDPEDLFCFVGIFEDTCEATEAVEPVDTTEVRMTDAIISAVGITLEVS
jgi:hypothetical protein